MTEPVHPADLQRDDGIRDRFRWDRFASPRFVTFGMMLALVVIVLTSGRPDIVTRETAERVGYATVGTARAVADTLSASGR